MSARFIFALTAALTMTGSGAALAADEPTSSDPIRIEEIVVTAQKRAENVQDVPLAVSVISGERLEQLSATQLADYASYVPGLNITSGGTAGQVGITLRGTASLDGSSTVGTYIDDSPLGSSGGYARASSFQLDMFPYDIQRIELLRGPQGTLYGASTMGGLLKYVMRTPDLQNFEFRAGGEALAVKNGDGKGWSARAGVNAPLVEGKLGLRASAFQQDTPGFIDNVGNGEEGENDVRQHGGRVAVLWKPSEQFSAQLAAMVQDIDTGGIAAVDVAPVTGVPAFGDLTRSHLYPEPFKQTTQSYSAALNWDLDGATLISATNFSRTQTHQTADITPLFGPFLPFFGFPAGSLAAFELELNLDKVTQEVRLASDGGGTVEWLAGAFYTHEDSENHQFGDVFALGSLDFVGRFQNAFIPTKYKEYAGFGDLTYNFSDRFDVTAGFRLAKNEQQFEQIVVGLLSPPVNLSGDSSEDVFTYMFSSSYHLTSQAMLYGRVASGYRPGGPNFTVPGFPIPPTFDADKLVNYELGLKSQFLEQRGTVNLSVFYIDWEDIKLTTIIGNFGVIENGRTAESKGAEFSSTFSPVRGLELGANVAYTDATLTEDVIDKLGATAVSGATLPGIAEWTGSLTADYSVPVTAGWTAHLGAGYRYVGSRLSGFSLVNPRSHFPSYDLVDASASIESDRWTARLFARNITDERAYINGSGLGSYFTIIQPRTVGLTVEVRF